MGMASLFAGLGGALYELPKKAVSLASLQELGVDGDCSKYLKKATYLLNDLTRQLNGATGGLNEAGIKEYAINGNAKVESVLRLTDYVQGCDSFAKIPQLTDTAQKVVDHAIQYAHEQGREIPFTTDPILNMVLSVGIVGAVIFGYKFLKADKRLFHDYSTKLSD